MLVNETINTHLALNFTLFPTKPLADHCLLSQAADYNFAVGVVVVVGWSLQSNEPTNFANG